MNPALPKPALIHNRAGVNLEEMHKQFSKAKIELGIAKKGRAG
ncbi:unnamed protein product [marine sediment metagenome]|uniref:Uncharacterized protein n=1 Tax=marine sediment metagenome TaxID=412755 RepID=X1R2A0_9ZZZZ